MDKLHDSISAIGREYLAFERHNSFLLWDPLALTVVVWLERKNTYTHSRNRLDQ